MVRRVLPPPDGEGTTMRPLEPQASPPVDLRPTSAPRRRNAVAVSRSMEVKPAAGRVIRSVNLTRGYADDDMAHLRRLGLRPRLHERCARAENITVRIWIVVCDGEGT